MVSGITSATHISESILAEGPRRIVAAVDTEEVDYYYASRALTRITAPSPSREEKRCFVISDLPFSYFGFIAASAGTFGLSKAGAARGWLIFGGVGIALGFAASYFDLWDRFKPKSSDKLWGEYKSAETLEERLKLIENLRNKGDDTAVKHLAAIFTEMGSRQKELEMAEQALDALLEERKLWEEFQKVGFEEETRDITGEGLDVLQIILKFPTAKNLARILRLPKHWDNLRSPNLEFFSSIDVSLAVMAWSNPLTVVETLLKKDEMKRANYVVNNLWKKLPASLPPPGADTHAEGWSRPSQIYYVAGRVAEAQQNWQVAMENYRKSLEQNPNAPRTHFHLATVSMELGYAGEAVAEFGEAIQYSEDIASMFERAIFTSLRSQTPDIAGQLLMKFDWKKFVTPLQKELYRAYQYHLEGKFKEAIPHYEAVLKLDSSHRKARFNLVMCHWNLGTDEDRVRAGEILQKLAKEMDEASPPETDDERNLRASIFHIAGSFFTETGEEEKANRYFDQALALYSSKEGRSLVLNQRGNLYLSRFKKPEEALKLYEQAIVVDPSNTLALLNRAYALKRLGRMDEAIGGAKAVIAHPDAPNMHKSTAHSRWADIMLNRGDERETLRLTTLAIVEDADNVDAHWTEAEVYEKRGEWEKALDGFERARKTRLRRPDGKSSQIRELDELIAAMKTKIAQQKGKP